MEIAAAILLKESFARTNAQDLLEDQFPDNEGERERVLKLFDAAMIKAQLDLENILPQIAPEEARYILEAVGSSRRNKARSTSDT